MAIVLIKTLKGGNELWVSGDTSANYFRNLNGVQVDCYPKR